VKSLNPTFQKKKSFEDYKLTSG